MSEGQSNAPHRLRWWFWLVLFLPATVALAGTAMVIALGRGPGGLFFANIILALPLNFLCANAAAKQLVLLRDARGSSSPWRFLWGPLIFFLNVAIVLSGCAAMR